jgi:hypothetical protein
VTGSLPNPQQTIRVLQRGWELVAAVETTLPRAPIGIAAAAEALKQELKAIGWRPYTTQEGI